MTLQHIYCILPLPGKEVAKLMKQHGWELNRISGSHHIMVRPGKRSVHVPIHGDRDLPKGLTHAILKQAGITHI